MEVIPVSSKFNSLHNGKSVVIIEVYLQSSDTDDPEEVLIHMAQHERYISEAESGEAYFPPTFGNDDIFTHATAIPKGLITTSNHFYTCIKGECMCLKLSHSVLYKIGIITKFEEPKPVGQT